MNAVARLKTTASAVEELVTEVTKALFDHDDELLRLIAIVAGKYPAVAVSIARGAARGAPHIARAVQSAAEYGTASSWDPIRPASILFFDRHSFQGIPDFTSMNPATWPPELLNTSKTKSAGVDVAWRHWSSNHYQQSPNGQSASASALSVSIDSRES